LTRSVDDSTPDLTVIEQAIDRMLRDPATTTPKKTLLRRILDEIAAARQAADQDL
jgi:hypothetical protein